MLIGFTHIFVFLENGFLSLDMGAVPKILNFFLLMQGENIDYYWEVRSFYLI
jgi:hypothetical protein